MIRTAEQQRIHDDQQRHHERQRLILVRTARKTAVEMRDAADPRMAEWTRQQMNRPTVSLGWLMAETCRTLALPITG